MPPILTKISNCSVGSVIFEAEVDGQTEFMRLGLAVILAYKAGADLRSADLSAADLRGAYLRGADLRSADLSAADLRGADLSGAYLSRAYLSDADLRSAYLSGADLRSADLSGADLSGADLRGADLRSADLSDADLSGAYLNRADLSGADLRGADLSRAYLNRAYLNRADLSGAYLNRADLSDADLSGASLSAADLSGAYLSGAKGLSKFVTTSLYLLLDQPGLIRAYKLVNTENRGPHYQTITYTLGQKYEVKQACRDEQTQCAPGINLATLDWCMKEWRPGYRILIAEFCVADIAAIPIGSDGKFRVFRCEIVGEKDLVELGLAEPETEKEATTA